MAYVPLKHLSVLIDNSGQKGSVNRSAFMQVLERGLRNSGAELVTEAAPGVIVLKINKLEEDKTVSAYSAVRQVREFNHYIELDFLAERQLAAGEPRQVEATVRAEKVQIYDSQYVLGSAEEESSIRGELRAEAVRLLALRLSVLK